MKIGIGLPNPVPGTPGHVLLDWARRGEPVVDGVDLPVGPTPVNDARVPILIGGTSDKAIRRVVTWADGWTVGGAGADQAGQMYDQVRAAWQEAGRSGEPRLAALAYYSIGAEAEEESRSYLRHY